MRFHLSHLLLGTTLLCLTLVLVGEEAWTYIAVAALFAAVFSITSPAQSRAWNGAKGAIVGWGAAMFFGLAIHIAGYWSHTGSQPYFEDGIVWGLIGAPVYATAFFSIPLAAMGVAIGLGTSSVAKLIGRYRSRKRKVQSYINVDATTSRFGKRRAAVTCHGS